MKIAVLVGAIVGGIIGALAGFMIHVVTGADVSATAVAAISVVSVAVAALGGQLVQIGIAQRNLKQARAKARYDELLTLYTEAGQQIAADRAYVLTHLGGFKRAEAETFQETVAWYVSEWNVEDRIYLQAASRDARAHWDTATNALDRLLDLKFPIRDDETYETMLDIAAEVEVGAKEFHVAAWKHLATVWPGAGDGTEPPNVPTKVDVLLRLRGWFGDGPHKWPRDEGDQQFQRLILPSTLGTPPPTP